MNNIYNEEYTYLNNIFDHLSALNNSCCELFLIKICKIHNIKINDDLFKIDFYKLYDSKIREIKDFYKNTKITSYEDYNFIKINKFFSKYNTFENFINNYLNDDYNNSNNNNNYKYKIYDIKCDILNPDCLNRLYIFYKKLNNYVRYCNIINNHYYKNIKNIINNIDDWKNKINCNKNNSANTIEKALEDEDTEYDIFDNFHDIFKNYINLILSINNIKLTSFHDFEYKFIKCCQIYNTAKDNEDENYSGNFIRDTCNNMVNLFYFSKDDHINENIFNILYNEVTTTMKILEVEPNRFYLE